MTRWLDEDEQQTWRAFLGAHRLVFDQLDRELQRDSGLPHTYYEILVRLSEAPDRALRVSGRSCSGSWPVTSTWW